MSRRGENIRKRKDGRWEGRYTCPGIEGAKPKICSVYAKTYKDVRKKLSEVKQEAGGQRQNTSYTVGKRSDQILFGDIAQSWLASIYENKKYSTYIKYKQLYDKYLMDFLKNRTLNMITEDFMEHCILPHATEISGFEKLSESMKKHLYCVMNQILAYASKEYCINKCTLQGEPLKPLRCPVSVFTIAEQNQLVDFLQQNMDRYKFGILLCLNTGLRLGELCALKWQDIDMENRVIYVSSTVQRLPVLEIGTDNKRTALMETAPKSFCSKREIPINDALFQRLREYQQDAIHKYVIGGESPADPRTYQKKFASYLTEIGIEYRSFHTLRHTFASNCAARGAETKALSEILGHSDVKLTLNCYVHPSLNVKRYYLNLLPVNLEGTIMGQIL